MIHIPDSYNTKDWTTVALSSPLIKEHWDSLIGHNGSSSMFHVYRAGTAIKFEYKEDAEWFKSRWRDAG